MFTSVLYRFLSSKKLKFYKENAKKWLYQFVGKQNRFMKYPIFFF